MIIGVGIVSQDIWFVVSVITKNLYFFRDTAALYGYMESTKVFNFFEEKN